MGDIMSGEKVAEAINAIMGEVGYIQKKGTNSFHNYKFAAIGDVLAELQPAMHKAGLIIIQDEIAHTFSDDGSILLAKYAFKMIHKSGDQWPDIAHHTGMAGARTKNGAPDDKAMNKCHTAARKYFLMALFQIPTGDHADPDADGDVVVHDKGKEPKTLYVKPEGVKSSAALKREVDFPAIIAELHECQSEGEVNMWSRKHAATFASFPPAWTTALNEKIDAHLVNLQEVLERSAK